MGRRLERQKGLSAFLEGRPLTKIREVRNPFAVGSGRFEGAIEHVRSDGGRRPLTQIGRQAPPPRTGFEGL